MSVPKRVSNLGINVLEVGRQIIRIRDTVGRMSDAQ
jgi:hypothetical protein